MSQVAQIQPSDHRPVLSGGAEAQRLVSAEVYTWRLEAAEDAIDLLLEVLDAWASRPSKLTRDWARDYGHAVAALSERRASLRK